MEGIAVGVALIVWLAFALLYLLIVVFVLVVIFTLPGYMRRQEQRAQKSLEFLQHLDGLPTRIVFAQEQARRDAERTKREAEELEFVAFRESQRR